MLEGGARMLPKGFPMVNVLQQAHNQGELVVH